VAHRYSIHAEQACLFKCKNKKILSQCTLILVNLNQNGLQYCTSCPQCQKLLTKYKIKLIVYYDQ
jgi:deoxycytidylate deaminase